MTMNGIEKFYGGCPHDCPDTCALVYEVSEGKLLAVHGNRDHPITRGGLCVKVDDYEKRHYHNKRVLYPLRRIGPKGKGQFERISWEQALSEITERWKEIIDEYGPQAIMPYSYAGNQGLVHGLNGGDAFFNRLGATVCERTLCGSGSSTAWLLTYGASGGLDPESFIHSKYIVVWACNSVVTNLHHWRIVKEAQKKGAKIVVIDSYKSRTAKLADWHLMPKPGTDGALAMAIINCIISEDLTDKEYIEKYTIGYTELTERSKERTPEWAEGITGIKAESIRTLAREFATTKSAAIRVGVALERHQGGGQTIRAVCCIPALTGAWRHVGGGIYQMPFWEHPYKLDVISRPDLIPEGTRVISNIRIGRALLGEIPLDPPIKSMMCWNANPVVQTPEADKIAQGLLRNDLFLVSAEHFISDTASFADIVLPACMGAEMEDIILSWGHNYLTYNTKCVEAPGEALSNREIFRRLAGRMGFEDECFTWSDSECLQNFIDWKSPLCEGIDLKYLRQNGYARLDVGEPDTRAPHKEGGFPTPSGKCEFLSMRAADGNFVVPPFRQMYEAFPSGESLDLLPDYVPPRESVGTNENLSKKYPLSLVSPKSFAFLNSCYGNMQHKIDKQGEQSVLICHGDASQRAIKEGDDVRVFNERGTFDAKATITEDVPGGLVVVSVGYWRKLTEGTVNSVNSAEFANMGHAPSFSDNLVQVELAP